MRSGRNMQKRRETGRNETRKKTGRNRKKQEEKAINLELSKNMLGLGNDV